MAKESNVDRLAGLVADLATRQTEHLEQVTAQVTRRLDALERRLAAAEERQAKGMEGFARIGDKVGALASAMDRNMAAMAEARRRLVATQEQRLQEVRDAAAGLVPNAKGPAHQNPGPNR